MIFRLCLCTAALFAAVSAYSQQVHTYRTTSDLAHVLEPMPDAVFAQSSAASPLTISVDETKRYQTMEGFGGSITDGTAWLLAEKISPRLRNQIMTRFFDPSRGIGLSFLRQPIGSTDLSRNHYSFDDMPAGEQDPDLKHFSLRHDDAYVFPIIRQALNLNPSITVMVTPWSPPAWMKTKNQTMDGGALREDAMPEYASYLVRSLEAFRKEGVPVKYLSVQNEPLNETKDYPGTLMLASQAKRLIGKDLGPALRRAGLSTEILAYDHNWDHPEYPFEVLSDPQAAPYVAGTALHCYGGEVSAQKEIHERFPGKGIWMTECAGGTWQKESPLLATAHLLIDTTRLWAKSVSLWTMVLDTEHNPHAGGCGTCRGLVTLDFHTTPPQATYNGDFYALGHASKYVFPGATRIDSTSFGRESLESVAFQNIDGSIALLVLNNRREPAEFTLNWHGRELRTSLSPESFATYTWREDH
jgi:glucosylceramidase